MVPPLVSFDEKIAKELYFFTNFKDLRKFSYFQAVLSFLIKIPKSIWVTIFLSFRDGFDQKLKKAKKKKKKKERKKKKRGESLVTEHYFKGSLGEE